MSYSIVSRSENNVQVPVTANQWLPLAEWNELSRNVGMTGAGVGVGIAALLLGCGAPIGAVITFLAIAAISASGAAYGHYIITSDVDQTLALFMKRIYKVLNSRYRADLERCSPMGFSAGHAEGCGPPSLKQLLAATQGDYGLSINYRSSCKGYMKTIEPVLQKLERQLVADRMNPPRLAGSGAGPSGIDPNSSAEVVQQTVHGVSGADDFEDQPMVPTHDVSVLQAARNRSEARQASLRASLDAAVAAQEIWEREEAHSSGVSGANDSEERSMFSTPEQVKANQEFEKCAQQAAMRAMWDAQAAQESLAREERARADGFY